MAKIGKYSGGVSGVCLRHAGDYASNTRCEVTGSPKNVKAKRLNRAEASVVKKVRIRLRGSFCSISGWRIK